MVEPELTEVGELHSLTDWQVSEASEEAELDEFCSGAGGRTGAPGTEAEAHTGEETDRRGAGRGGAGRERKTSTREREDERSRVLGLLSPRVAATQTLTSPGAAARTQPAGDTTGSGPARAKPQASRKNSVDPERARF